MKFSTNMMVGLLCGTALTGFSTSAMAQAAPAEGAASETADTNVDDEVIVVTGTQIRGAKIDAILPVTVLNEEAIDTINPSSGDELFRAIPQAGAVAFNEQNTTGGVNGARGDIASINLRALGTGNTLLLINGRRMTLDPGFQTELLVPVVSPDTNSIVPGGIRRVEVLRDGASAIYGADAVAGVVNTVMRSNRTGGFVQANYRLSDGTGLYNTSFRGGVGFDFNEGRSNLTLYGNYFHENGAPASDRFYSASSDRRTDPRLVGTPFENDANFRNTSTLTPWGQFDIQGSGASGSTTIGDDDFQIQPNSFAGCRLDLGGGICADNGTSVDIALRYDLDADRTLYSTKDRYNATLLFNHELSDAVEFYLEGSFYRSKSSRLRESSANLTAVPIGISRNAYFNPLGATTLLDGSPNPNRLTNGLLNVAASGRDLIMERYRVIDGGPRLGVVDKNDFRIVAGLKGDLMGWDFDTGFVYHQANKTDLTKNRISTTLLQNAINRNDPTAYNPFNGGCYELSLPIPQQGDCTPSSQAAIDSITIDVFRKGETTLALADFKVSKPDLFTLPGGDVGLATGVEFRRETFIDDRDDRLDGTVTFTDSLTGTFFGSDVLGSSPSPDTSGGRNVFSGFAEAFVPLVSEDMDIPLVQALSLQLAGRIEHFDDIKETAIVPRVAASWTVFDSLMFRGAWSQGFRAPNLVQVNDLGTTRVNTRDDYVQCFAQIQQGQIANFDNCAGQGTISLRTGTNQLKPEKTESINLGVVITPSFIPGLTVTADYWRVQQNGIVGVFGDDNAIALDLLRRLNGSTNPNVIRDAPDADQILLFAGTGLDAVGDVARVLDPYLNLDSRTTKGMDFGLLYDIGDIGNLGEFKISVNAAYLESFFQSPGSDGQELLDAVADSTLPDSIVISDIGELREQNGRPKWRWTAALNWRSGPVRASLFGRYVGGVFDDSVTQDANDVNGNPNPDPGSFYRVSDWFVMNASISYTIENDTALDGTRIRFGVNNLTNEAPPLADQSYGFFSNLHNARGRNFTFSIRKNF